MKSANATASELRQHFNQYLNWVEQGVGRVQIVRHKRVAAVLVSERDALRLRELEMSEAQPQVGRHVEEEAPYSEEQRAQIDQRIFDPMVRELMGLPPLARS